MKTLKLKKILTEEPESKIDLSSIPLNPAITGRMSNGGSIPIKDKRGKGEYHSDKSYNKFKKIVPIRHTELVSAQDFLDAVKRLKNKARDGERLTIKQRALLKYAAENPWSLKPVQPKVMQQLINITNQIKSLSGVTGFKITGADDFHHRAYGKYKGGGWHDDSIALDFTFNNRNMTAKIGREVEKAILHLMTKIPNLGYNNEVTGDSEGKSGAHMHISLKPSGREVAKFSWVHGPNGEGPVKNKSYTGNENDIMAMAKRPENELRPERIEIASLDDVDQWLLDHPGWEVIITRKKHRKKIFRNFIQDLNDAIKGFNKMYDKFLHIRH